MAAETIHFIEAVAGDRPVLVTPEEARLVMEVTLAADLSPSATAGEPAARLSAATSPPGRYTSLTLTPSWGPPTAGDVRSADAYILAPISPTARPCRGVGIGGSRSPRVGLGVVRFVRLVRADRC